MGNSAASLLLSSTKTVHVLAVLLCDIYRPALECILECVFVDRPVCLIDIALLPLLRYPWDGQLETVEMETGNGNGQIII